jgi:hypothetical protein
MSPLLVICFFTWRFELASSLHSTEAVEAGFAPDPLFKGQVAIRVIERLAGPERDLNYLVDLDHGNISASAYSEGSGKTLSPGGRIDDCSFRKEVEIIAPNGELVADCTIASTDGKSLGYHVRIRNEESNETVSEWAEEKGWEIVGIVWSTDSSSIAVLSEKERLDFGLLGLISMTAGHPIQLETLRVTLFSVQPSHELKLPVIRKNSPDAWARIDWIQ